MGLNLYNPTRLKRKEFNQVTYHDACAYLRFVTKIHYNTQNFYNIGLCFTLLLHMTLKILVEPIDNGKVELKNFDSK